MPSTLPCNLPRPNQNLPHSSSCKIPQPPNFTSRPFTKLPRSAALAYSPSTFLIPALAEPVISTTTMSSAEAQIAYDRASPIEPMEAQYNFAQQFDLGDPSKAMSSYQKYVIVHPFPLEHLLTGLAIESCINTLFSNSRALRHLPDDDLHETVTWYPSRQRRAVGQSAQRHHEPR